MTADNHQFGVQLSTEGEKLRRTLQSRPSVDVATGILMATYSYTDHQAFAELRRVSLEHRIPLPDLAAALVGLHTDASTGRPDPLAEESANQRAAVQVASSTWEALTPSNEAADALLHRVLDSAIDTANDSARRARSLLGHAAPRIDSLPFLGPPGSDQSPQSSA